MDMQLDSIASYQWCIVGKLPYLLSYLIFFLLTGMTEPKLLHMDPLDISSQNNLRPIPRQFRSK